MPSKVQDVQARKDAGARFFDTRLRHTTTRTTLWRGQSACRRKLALEERVAALELADALAQDVDRHFVASLSRCFAVENARELKSVIKCGSSASYRSGSI